MAYIVDFNKAPDTLLRELINYENSIDLTADQITFVNLRPANKPGFNTMVDVWWKSTADMVGKVTVSFNRIDLPNLFSLVKLAVREVDINTQDGRPVLDQALFDEIKRRYNITFAMDDYTFTPEKGKWVMSAGADNVAYQGTVDLLMEASLASRAPRNILDGFWILPPDDIGYFLTEEYIGDPFYPVQIPRGMISAEMVTRAIDCTDFKSFLALDTVNNVFKASSWPTLVNTYLAPLGIPPFENVGPIVDLPTSSVPGALPGYNRVVVIENVVSETMAGRALFHYNTI